MKTSYRKYKEGDTIRVTGFDGRLFSSCGKRSLADGVEFGVEFVLQSGEDDDYDVILPEGILAHGNTFISVACIELVKPVEEQKKKPAIIEDMEEYDLFTVSNGEDTIYLAKIWYDNMPKEIAEDFAQKVKEAYDSTL